MVAHEQSCVNCDNARQPDKAQSHLGEVIGAFVIDIPVISEYSKLVGRDDVPEANLLSA